MNIDFVDERESECLSDLALDRLLAGEMEGTQEGWRAGAHLRACARCAARRAELEADAARFRQEIFVEGLAARAAREARSRRWRSAWAGASAAAAAAVVVVALAVAPEPPAGIRTKGGAALELFARGSDGAVERVLPGDVLRPGDAIRFEVQVPAPSWVAVVGIDAAQVVTPYVAPASLGAGREILPGSIVLDETPGAERILALFCDEPIATERLVEEGRRALAAAGGDPAALVELQAEGCMQSSVLIRKERRK